MKGKSQAKEFAFSLQASIILMFRSSVHLAIIFSHQTIAQERRLREGGGFVPIRTSQQYHP